MEPRPILFRDAYSRNARVVPSQFEEDLFLRCVPPLQRPAARLLLWLKPGLFERDLATMREVAEATSPDDVRRSARDLRGGGLYRSSVVRDGLGVRASGRRLVAIAREVMKPDHR